jgi:hypothetical protein
MMFGLKRMHKQRERLYLRTQILEKQAKATRKKAVDKILDKATSPTGLLASFVLGASTQLDITQKMRKNVLDGASRDVLSFLITQAFAYMNAANISDSEKVPSNEEESMSSTAPVTASKGSDY